MGSQEALAAGRTRAARPGAERSLTVVERAFTILEAFSPDHPEWSASDLSRELGLPVPTAHRLLGTLQRLGYVSRDEATKRFRLGGAARRLGEQSRGFNDLRTVALWPLRRLSQATGETALLTVLDPERDHSLCLERVETSQPLRLSVEVGRRLPLHAGASQKALLAFMADEEINRLLSRPLERLCAATITNKRLLRQELRDIRWRGWATSHEETNVGVWGVAVPVVSESDVVCAIGVAGPSPRLTDAIIAASLEWVRESALAVARSLGLTVPAAASVPW